mmetsp:Transcript_82555/g.168248  ORF Transcript_82555/g.168248 Transcript_82555/m.168248 type:complete len:330 (+) Transcript_82555:783-1772(+)
MPLLEVMPFLLGNTMICELLQTFGKVLHIFRIRQLCKPRHRMNSKLLPGFFHLVLFLGVCSKHSRCLVMETNLLCCCNCCLQPCWFLAGNCLAHLFSGSLACLQRPQGISAFFHNGFLHVDLEGTFNRGSQTSFVSRLSGLPELSGGLGPDLVCPHGLFQAWSLVFPQATANHCLHGCLEFPVVQVHGLDGILHLTHGVLSELRCLCSQQGIPCPSHLGALHPYFLCVQKQRLNLLSAALVHRNAQSLSELLCACILLLENFGFRLSRLSFLCWIWALLQLQPRQIESCSRIWCSCWAFWHTFHTFLRPWISCSRWRWRHSLPCSCCRA